MGRKIKIQNHPKKNVGDFNENNKYSSEANESVIMGELEAKFVQNLNNGFGGNGDASMKAYGSLNCPSMIGPTVTQTAPNTSNNKNANNSGSNSIRFQSPYAMTNINNNGKSDGGDEIVGSGVGGLGCDVLVSGNIEDRFQLNHHLSSPRKTANVSNYFIFSFVFFSRFETNRFSISFVSHLFLSVGV